MATVPAICSRFNWLIALHFSNFISSTISQNSPNQKAERYTWNESQAYYMRYVTRMNIIVDKIITKDFIRHGIRDVCFKFNVCISVGKVKCLLIIFSHFQFLFLLMDYYSVGHNNLVNRKQIHFYLFFQVNFHFRVGLHYFPPANCITCCWLVWIHHKLQPKPL